MEGARERPNGGKSRGASKARAVAAAGVVASVGVGAFGAADAQASKIYACYSKSTKVLQHAGGSHCPKGFKSVSWNKKGLKGAKGATGAQGAQGAQGAVGPNGAVIGYTALGTSRSVSESVSTPVASFTPAVRGAYAVNGMADFITANAEMACGEYNPTAKSTINYGYEGQSAEWSGDIATNGILNAGPASPVIESCYVRGDTAHLYQAQVTGTLLTTANRAGAPYVKPANAFTKHHAFKK